MSWGVPSGTHPAYKQEHETEVWKMVWKEPSYGSKTLEPALDGGSDVQRTNKKYT